jgi:hypothetical protein
MKSQFFKGLLALIFALSFIVVSSSAAAHCQWHNGHRVCWSRHYNNCRWVHGHWRSGHWIPSHRVCWR